MATTEQTVINRQAPFLEDYARKLLESSYQRSQDAVDVPDIQIAGFTPDQREAVTKTREGVGTFAPFLQGADRAITDAIGRPSIDQTFGAQGIASFMNPFTQNVIDTTLADIGRQGQIAQNQLAAQSVGQGAFGGSRQAIAQNELASNILDQQARTAGQLRAAGFESALQQARNLADAQIRERSLLGQLAGQQAGLGGLQQQLQQQDVASLLGIGSLQQGQAQALLDAARQGDLQQAYEPFQRLGFFSDILRGVPTASQTVTATTAPTPSLLSQIGGVAATGLGLAGQLGYRPFAKNNTGLGSFNFNLGGSK
tara:strand:+ start:295 stop:1230 length:936 start_codon:yes stop_codon:yes gene_type:complete